MDFIWSPWRYQYISKADQPQGCVFCILPKKEDDQESYILYRGHFNYVVLNIFPYTSGHLMIVPFSHIALINDLPKEVSDEMMDLTKRAQLAIAQDYSPDGFNLGMNLGRAAGAGVAEHLHMHVLPRWIGDANFTSVIGETRVLPESLVNSYDRLKKHFQ